MTSTDDDCLVTYGSINCRVLVSDETSMDSSPLLAALLKHTIARHVVFVGDERQLQPIGVGMPLRDMVASGVIPTVHLTQNYRTNCLGILALCEDIRNGTVSVDNLKKYLKLGGVYYVPCEYRARPFIVAEHYADLVAKGIRPNDIRVLSPHNSGDTGTRSINIEVRSQLDLPPDKLVVGDILLITENDYQAMCCPGYPQVTKEMAGVETIFNGELCSIINVGSDFIDVEFEENCDGVRHVRLICPDGDDASSRLPDGVSFGRAMSVHKGQGSQFPAVVVVAECGHPRFGIVQQSNIYTAISRGIDMLIIVGSFDDLVHAALTPDLPRNTLLCELLIAGASK